MKKIALRTLIVTFIIGALLGIGIIVFDLWNETTAKFFLSFVTIFGFNVPALACD